jgi:hypothetical protein
MNRFVRVYIKGAATMTYTQHAQKLNFPFAAIALALAVHAYAAPVGPLTTFAAGTPAKASDVNGNFTTIVNTVNANDTRLTNVEATKQNAVTGNCPTGSAIRAVAANGTVTCQSTGGTVGVASVNSIVGVPLVTGTTTGVCLIFCLGNGRYQSSAGSDFLVAPITLPQGATITAFSFSCFCNHANGEFAVLFRDDDVGIANTSISTVSSTAIQTASTTAISTTPAGIQVVDNRNFSYFVLWSIDGTATSNIMPVRATVTYTLP